VRRTRVLALAALLLAAPVAIATASPAQAADVPSIVDEQLGAGVMRVGEVVPADLRLGYATGRVAAPSQVEVSQPGATYIKVHFARLRLAPGDFVTVADPQQKQVYLYQGDPTVGAAAPGDSDYTLHGQPGFAAMSIDGDTAVVTVHSARTSPARPGYGVHINGFWRGFTDAEVTAHNPQVLSVCGTDARRDTVCYRTSHPTEYARSNAVGRLLISGGGLCTAFRVGRTNAVLTNNHCISTAASVRGSEVQFNFQCASCGGNNPFAGTRVSGNALLRTSGSLDYTLFSVNNFAAISSFGTLFLDVRAPVLNERIYIPGHGDGRPKRLSIFETSQGGTTCRVNNPRSDSINMGYNCDTSGGNSGSPVLAGSSHRVIALHHLGGCLNEGTRINLIYPQISSLIDNSG
jgi:V8-like Glu-specific endopeptidase